MSEHFYNNLEAPRRRRRRSSHPPLATAHTTVDPAARPPAAPARHAQPRAGGDGSAPLLASIALASPPSGPVVPTPQSPASGVW
jgi:hypothetical protein